MTLYFRIMLNAIQSNTIYRFNTFIITINRILFLLVNVSLWVALYNGTDVIDENQPITLSKMVTYVIMTEIIAIFVGNNNIYGLSHKVSTGEIAISLIKPIGLFQATLFEQLGNKVFIILFEISPVLFAGWILFGFNFPSMLYLMFFIVALIFSFMVYFLMTFVLGLLSFWYMRVFHLDFVLNQAIRFFSGAWIPVWFFPEKFQSILMFLPFELVYFTPIRIFLEEVSYQQLPYILLKYFIYIAVFAILSVVIWKRGIQKLIIQGG